MRNTKKSGLPRGEPRPKHPKLDEIYPEMEKLIFWAARRLAKQFGGLARDYWGNLYLRLNYLLYTYDPEKGKLSTYFLYSLKEWACRQSRYDNEREHLANYYRCNANVNVTAINWDFQKLSFFEDSERLKTSDITRLIDDVENSLCFERADDCDWISRNFDSTEQMWEWLLDGLSDKHKAIITARYRDGKKLHEIAEVFGVTKERIRQLQLKAEHKIRMKVRDSEIMELVNSVQELSK